MNLVRYVVVMLLVLIGVGWRGGVALADDGGGEWVSAENLPANLSHNVESNNEHYLHENGDRFYIHAGNQQNTYVLRYRLHGELEGGFKMPAGESARSNRFGINRSSSWVLVHNFTKGDVRAYDWNGNLVRTAQNAPVTQAGRPPQPVSDSHATLFVFGDRSIYTFDSQTFEAKAQYEFEIRCDNGQPARFVESLLDINPDVVYLAYQSGGCGGGIPSYTLAMFDQSTGVLSNRIPLGTSYHMVAHTTVSSYISHTAQPDKLTYLELVNSEVVSTLVVDAPNRAVTPHSAGFGFGYAGSVSSGQYYMEPLTNSKRVLLTAFEFEAGEQQLVTLDMPMPFAASNMQVVVMDYGTVWVFEAQTQAQYFVKIENAQPIDEAVTDDCVIPSSGPWPPCATGGSPTPPASGDCVIPASGPWPPCATGGSPAPPAQGECVIPPSGPWPACATGGGQPPNPPSKPDCVIPPSGPWPACARRFAVVVN